MTYDGPKRFNPDATADYAQFKRAAVDYTSNLTDHHKRGLYEKPLDWGQGHPTYFSAMYQLLNGLQALALTPGARVLEIGAGSGWATEIMASLAYRVTAIEPNAEMIEVAKERVLAHVTHHGRPELFPNVSWICSTMEECDLPPSGADAAIYFESFHHVVDEHEALKRTFAALKPGGQLLILGDSNWIPGNAEQESPWVEEMATYGTLESPFTDGYLTWLLTRHGFADIKRHHTVNGLIPVEREAEPVSHFIHLHALGNNLVVARKPEL